MKLLKTINFILIILVILAANIYSQHIEIQISNYNGNTYLSSVTGEKNLLIDSISAGENSIYKFSLDKNKYNSGVYRFSLGSNAQSLWINFIYDGEDVKIRTDANNLSDSLKIISSEGNKLYYQFIKLNKEYKTKTELLQLILSRYPNDDDFYKATQSKLHQLQNEYLDFVNNVSQKRPNSFISRYIKSSQLPVVNPNLSMDKQLTFLKNHSLDNIDFNDDELVNSDVFTNKTIEYLTYYRNPQLTKELLEQEFEKAVDSILTRAKANLNVYSQIVEYLIDGFKKFGFDKVLDYIVGNYVIKDDLCLDVKTEGLIKRRIDQAKYFKIGNFVPDIVLSDSSGNVIELNKTTAKETLIVFYASWCPHCKELLPRLNELYKSQKEKKFELFSISLDTSRKDWTDFITNNNLGFINVSDLKGWDGKAASDYFIYATPTMFMIDRQLKIIFKPMSVEEVRSIIN